MQSENHRTSRHDRRPPETALRTGTGATGTTLVVVLVWLTGLVGILHAEPAFGKIFGSGHSICGVWGCGPPLSSLLVWHAFVGMVAIPAAVVTAVKFPAEARRWGTSALAVTLATAAVFVFINTANWWQGASAFARGFVLQRSLFSLVAFTDAPIIPCGAAVGVYWWLGRRGVSHISRG